MDQVFDEVKTQASIEFSEILTDLHRLEKAREPIFSALFIDQKPLWRKKRYNILLHSLRAALKDEITYFIKNKSTDELYDKTYQLITILKTRTLLDDKKVYLNFMTQLRKILNSDEYIKHCKDNTVSIVMLRSIVTAFFTEIHLNSFCRELAQMMKVAGLEHIEKPHDFFDFFVNARIGIEHAPHALKVPLSAMIWQFAQGQLNLHYDPYMQDNTPYRQFNYPLSRIASSDKPSTLPCIRMGTPTQESFLAPITKKATITPEFLGFLEAYRASNKRHLYINLQNRNPAWTGRNEAPRCRAIEALSVQFPETIVVITLAKNTAFYHQESIFYHLDDSLLFKKAFLEQLHNPKGGFYFGDLKEFTESDKTFLMLMDKVHQEHYGDKPILTRDERLDFIELFYLELEKYCIQHLSIHSFNMSCKDGIDRAGGANALLFLDIFLPFHKKLYVSDLQQPLKDNDSLENKPTIYDLQSVLFAPALLVKKRAITQGRFDRFISAAMRLIFDHHDTTEPQKP